MKQFAIAAAATALAVTGASAQENFHLRVQSLLSAESISGQHLEQYFEDLEVMSAGRITSELFFSSSIVKSVETFDAVVNGILDGDTTQPSYQIGKDTAFQFVGDVMGGYETPWQMYAFLYYGGGLEAARELYAEYDMFLVGWWIHGPESLSSTRSLAGPEDLENFKFRSPPGMITGIFDDLGASPIVMDFTEVFTALETGVIDGADASNLSINKSLGLYDIAEHATYPGFHSMPADHFAIRLETWESMPEDLQRIMEVGWQKHAFRTSLANAVDIQKTANELAAAGVTLHEWSAEDLREYRESVVAEWENFADTDRARELVAMHKDFLGQIGLLESAE
jgi:TRAP-type C4-dicarboxylate transport system substrate-binding protein